MDYTYKSDSEDDKSNWYNYTTGEYDYRNIPAIDDEALIYLPQNRDVQGIYHRQRGMGDSVLNAMASALKAMLGRQ